MSDMSPINYYNLIPDFRKEALQQSQNLAIQTQNAATQQQMQRQSQADARQQAFRADFAEAYHSDDPSAMQALAAKYPDQYQQISGVVSFQNDAQRQQVGDVASKLMLAERTGNPQAIAATIAQNADVITGAGADPRELMQLAVTNPEQFRAVIGSVRMGALTPQEQVAAEDAQQGRQLQRDQLAETIRNNNNSNAQGWARIGLQREGLEADKEMRQLAREQQAYQRQLDAAKTVLQQQEIQQKIDAKKQEAAQAAEFKMMGLGYAQEAADMAAALAEDPRLNNITGLRAKVGTLNPTSQDLINSASRLQSLLTQDNLKLMTGVLTDRDIQFLGRISSGLNVTDNGIQGSTGEIRNQLRSISKKLNDKLVEKGYKSSGTTGMEAQATQAAQAMPQQPQTQQVAQPQQGAAPMVDYSTIWGGQ